MLLFINTKADICHKRSKFVLIIADNDLHYHQDLLSRPSLCNAQTPPVTPKEQLKTSLDTALLNFNFVVIGLEHLNYGRLIINFLTKKYVVFIEHRLCIMDWNISILISGIR